eukprot:TRINITY_DN4709_c0_g1_i2.p1 TRINITY_DN4709_c0_g1~~TRINITY_DN4709_c0_g1_i2.p1  ORF type:complete len:186 (+),score=70.78 TRINITY_DN4709_c0_g1_i2:174-731(+)
MDRAATPYFGVLQYGVHVNGYVSEAGRVQAMWIGRRSATKAKAPHKLDQMVAGGLPIGESAEEALYRECEEEASISREIVDRYARPASLVSYIRPAELTLTRNVFFIYDMELPADVVPVNQDGEVSEFMLKPIEEVMDLVAFTDEFKYNCGYVIMDWLVRHGFISNSDPYYVDVVSGLRAPRANV